MEGSLWQKRNIAAAVATVTIIMNITNRMIIMTIVTAVMTTMIIVIVGMNIITTKNITMPAVAAAAVAADTTITKIKRSCSYCFWAQASLRRVFW